jgi:hypothetical protein
MAYTKKTATENVEEVKVETAKAEKKKTYDKEDGILCKSITNGLLLVTGEKSNILYKWADYGDVEEVEYQDLIYMIRSRKACIYKPRFVIQDEDIVAQYPELKTLYDSLYSTKDLTEILNLPIPQMKAAIAELPDGALEAIKGVAASNIYAGRYDSVKKIKALDEIFGTQLLLTLAQN